MDEDLQPIRMWMTWFADAVRRRDYARGRELFHDQVRSFGTAAECVRGLDRLVNEQWRRIWSITEGFDFFYDQVSGARNGSSAWVIAPWSSTGFDDNGRPFERIGRATLIFEFHEERWLAVHSHFSLTPSRPTDSKRD